MEIQPRRASKRMNRGEEAPALENSIRPSSAAIRVTLHLLVSERRLKTYSSLPSSERSSLRNRSFTASTRLGSRTRNLL